MADTTSECPPKAAYGRSYLGIGSCLLFGIAAALISGGYLANIGAQHKMAGLELIIVFPFALLLSLVGASMGAVGLRNRSANPLSLTGLCLNVLPVLYFAGRIVGAIIVSALNI